MSTSYDTPKKPTPEIMEWIDSSWGINDEGVLVWIRDGESKGIKAGDPIYCGLMSNGYMICRTSTKPRRALKAHHLVWYFTTGEWPALSMDHIDRNRANNSFSNLRLATKSQNMANRKNWRNQYKGVFKTPQGRGYAARIRKDGIATYLGYFKTPEEASKAYLAAAEKLHGQYAYHLSQEVI